jgi:hypothetical protein
MLTAVLRRRFKKRHLFRGFSLLRLRLDRNVGNQCFNHGMPQVFRGADMVIIQRIFFKCNLLR